MKELNKENWSANLKRFHANLTQVNEELEKITPEVRARCNETEANKGDKIEMTHCKWVEHDEER